MTITGSDVVAAFKAYCDEYNKLYIPDSPREDAVADSIAKHYNSDILLEAIKKYVQSEEGPFLLFDFAIKSRTLIENAKFEKASVDRFKEIVEETRKKLQDEL
jgi:hypothetical protein